MFYRSSSVDILVQFTRRTRYSSRCIQSSPFLGLLFFSKCLNRTAVPVNVLWYGKPFHLFIVISIMYRCFHSGQWLIIGPVSVVTLILFSPGVSAVLICHPFLCFLSMDQLFGLPIPYNFDSCAFANFKRCSEVLNGVYGWVPFMQTHSLFYCRRHLFVSLSTSTSVRF